MCAILAAHALMVLTALALMMLPAVASAQADRLADRVHALQDAFRSPIRTWKFFPNDGPHGERVDFDDSAWRTVPTGHQWPGENTKVWFRTRLTIPPVLRCHPTRGLPVRLRIGVDDDGEIYVDGKLAQSFNWDKGDILVTPRARPGQTFVIAVRGINRVGTGQMRFCEVTCGMPGTLSAALDDLSADARALKPLAAQWDLPGHERIDRILRRSADLLDRGTRGRRSVAELSAAAAAAKRKLMTLAPLLRQYDVYYVGHAHIDMNWLWPWPETIDVCHRTWDSAMKLMGEFPDLGFVQSQPGAYVPIQKQFPAEFARMQQAVRRGQWEPVGGLWDESDTNLPSGEAIARSLFLGQRYFKQHFGRYAVTGWLPDSFGHSWQLPQLMAGVGITSFYHMRGGVPTPFSWWQSPDGTRVLKAQTEPYNAEIEPVQVGAALNNDRLYNIKRALVVFGVGDHGGGPTREQIQNGKALQANPLLPRVHFTTAGEFFNRLRSDPRAGSLPIISTDLQYCAEGCYTTHADIKAAVRDSENSLYTAEALGSLAAMRGRPYPVAGLSEAWKPTAFAQFHDIMCGSAIHSTYDWMKEQMAPSRRFVSGQIDQALAALAAASDTRGGFGIEPAILVCNTLSFARRDVVRVHVPRAAQYREVYDSMGHAAPVQQEGDDTIVFVPPYDVSGFGTETYFLQAGPPESRGSMVRESRDSFDVASGGVHLVVSRESGLIADLEGNGVKNLLSGPGDELDVLGDDASAWPIHFTGERNRLTTQGAKVTLLASGPVFTTIRVEHAFGKSTFRQDITVYEDLPRVDVPTTVDWHEHHRMLKVAFPLAMKHPACRVSIPYGSIERPHNGQENPAQKWMDVSEQPPGKLIAATPLDVAPLFNHDSLPDFDFIGNGMPRSQFPAPGMHRMGRLGVPFRFPNLAPGAPDNVACDGQLLKLPAPLRGNTLFIIAAAAPSAQDGEIRFLRSDGQCTAGDFRVDDWIVPDLQTNESVATFSYEMTHRGRVRNPDGKPHLWLAAVPIPPGAPVTGLLLPENTRIHIFAATLASVEPAEPEYGLTVLNNCKYGSDTTGPVFRLSLLRSPSDPDPNPDEGIQKFTYALLPHAGDCRAAGAEQAGLALNIPLLATVTTHHAPQTSVPAAPIGITTADGRQNVVAGALKHAEDGAGYILRLFETEGRDTTAILTFGKPVRVSLTDILERSSGHPVRMLSGRTAAIPIGHDRIVTLRILGLPDAGVSPDMPQPAP
jgi:alpha-mannosidase